MTREEVFGGLKEVIAIIRPHTDLSKVSFDSQLIKNADTWAITTACEDYTDLLRLVNWLYSEEGQFIRACI